MNGLIAWMAAAILAATAHGGAEAGRATAGPRLPDASPPAATLTVSLNGPGTVRPSVQCYWWADAAGGTPPYSYSFSGGLSGYSILYEYFTTSPSSGSFTVSVTVTDALGATATANRPVSVSSRAPICPY